ncbi:Ferritin-like domain-domain containing protein, partial [Rhodotorula toruloides]
TTVKALERAIIALGAQPFQGCSFNFGRALSDPLEFLAVARAVEAVGQGAYLGAAHLVSDPSLLTAAGSILTVEARHQSFLNLLSGGTFEAQSFDLAFSPAQVLALVGGFLQGCQASDLCVRRLLRFRTS